MLVDRLPISIRVIAETPRAGGSRSGAEEFAREDRATIAYARLGSGQVFDAWSGSSQVRGDRKTSDGGVLGFVGVIAGGIVTSPATIGVEWYKSKGIMLILAVALSTVGLRHARR